jgi:hypothetical protein
MTNLIIVMDICIVQTLQLFWLIAGYGRSSIDALSFSPEPICCSQGRLYKVHSAVNYIALSVLNYFEQNYTLF